MVVGAVVVGYRRECTRELTREQLGTSKNSKAKLYHSGLHVFVVHVFVSTTSITFQGCASGHSC